MHLRLIKYFLNSDKSLHLFDYSRILMEPQMKNYHAVFVVTYFFIFNIIFICFFSESIATFIFKTYCIALLILKTILIFKVLGESNSEIFEHIYL